MNGKKSFLLMGLAAVAVALDYVFDLGGASMLMAAVAPAVVDAGTTKANAAEGIAGKETQFGGQEATVSHGMEAASDLILPDVDQELTKIHSDFNILDTVKRRVKKQKKVKSAVVEHWMIDEAKPMVTIGTTVTASGKQVVFTLESGDENLLNPYYTCMNLTTMQELYIIAAEANGNITAVSVDENDDNVIVAKGDKLVLLASAGYETQKVIAPSTMYPIKERLYLQKQICNIVTSDYFNQARKEIPYNEAQQAEASLNDFRHKSSRAAWIGKGGKRRVKPVNGNVNGPQDAYIAKGLYWQFKRKYQLAGQITFNDIINLAKSKASRFGGSKKWAFFVGSELLADFQKIDFTKHADVTQTKGEIWGLACTQLHTVFGDFHLILDIALDECGFSKSGAVIDEENLVRYYMKNEEISKEGVQDEEATRSIVTTWDCLALKGYSHIWVDGTGVQQDGIATIETITTAAKLPTTNQVIGQTVYLTADDGNYKKDKAYTWDGTAWKLASVELPSEVDAV